MCQDGSGGQLLLSHTNVNFLYVEQFIDFRRDLSMEQTILIGGGGDNYSIQQGLTLKYANRHGLVVGATGTGKMVTLQIMAAQTYLR